MTAVKGIAIAVSIVTVLAGAVAPVAAGPGCPPQDPTCGGATCVINGPAGNTLKGHVAVAWVFNSSTGDYDADVVLALERAGGQAFFRVSLSRYTQAIDQVSQASLACDVISATGSA